MDEYPIHQFAEPVRVVDTTDARAYERYWFTAQEETGAFFLVTGFGVYPNLDTADAYAILVADGRHTSVRMHRVLGDDRATLRFGPLTAEVVEPFREWRLRLDDNEQGLQFDIRWRDTKRAVFQRTIGTLLPDTQRGRLVPETAGYESFGRVEGTIRLGDRVFEVDPRSVRGSRDHHWGVRDGVGGRGHMESEPRTSHCGQWVEFGDWSIWGWRCLYNLGDGRQGAEKIVKKDYRLKFDETTKHLRGGIVTNTFATGEVKEIEYEQIGDQVAYLRCGMYAGPTGGTPDGDIYHGMYVGDDVVAGRSDDIRDPAVQMALAGFEDHLCIARCDGETTVGILECLNPLLYEMCRSGVPGYSLLD